MSSHRFYLPKPSWDAGKFLLAGDEAHHCSRVFRHQAGDEIEIFDGKGQSAPATISAVQGKTVQLNPGEIRFSPALPVFITLAAAIPKAKTMDLIVQKAAEIGAGRIVPLMTERTVVRMDAREGARKQEKWQRTALESCKQCGRNWLPEVTPPQTLKQWQASNDADLNLVASLRDGTAPLRDILHGEPQSVSVVIGPEGDFSDAEYDQLEAQGFHPLTLGPTVLRAETATFQAMAILSYELFR